MTNEHSDVLVVGAGPVGLATASLLGRRGWTVTVLAGTWRDLTTRNAARLLARPPTSRRTR